MSKSGQLTCVNALLHIDTTFVKKVQFNIVSIVGIQITMMGAVTQQTIAL